MYMKIISNIVNLSGYFWMYIYEHMDFTYEDLAMKHVRANLKLILLGNCVSRIYALI